MNRKFIPILFLLALLLPSIKVLSKPLNMTVHAQSAILMDANSGKVLFAKNPHEKREPGSTTKIAACITALQLITDENKEVSSPLICLEKTTKKKKIENGYQDRPYILEPDGTSYGIITNEKMTIRDLLHGMMLCSGNDAANVIAYHLSENRVPGFMEKVNEWLQSIGCKDTFFNNPHGLHFRGHLSTAYDLALMTKEGIKNPRFRELVSTVKYERPKTNKQQQRTIWTNNRLLKKGKYFYPKAFGIKTGYHENAGSNVVSAASDGSRTLIAVSLGGANKDEVYSDVIKMFETAFSEKKLTRKLLNKLDFLQQVKVKGAKSFVQATLKEDLLYEYFPSEEEEIHPEIVWQELKMPIIKDEVLGEVVARNQLGETILQAKLYAKESAKPTFGYLLGRGVYYAGYLIGKLLWLLTFVSPLIFCVSIYFFVKEKLNKKPKKVFV